MTREEAVAEAARRPLTEDERALMTHVMMFGSDGYPVSRCGSRHWQWSFRSIEGPPVVFPRKRDAVASLEAFLAVLREQAGLEARARFMIENNIAETGGQS